MSKETFKVSRLPKRMRLTKILLFEIVLKWVDQASGSRMSSKIFSNLKNETKKVISFKLSKQ